MTEKEYRLVEDPAETRRVEAALRAPDGWPKPPAGFEERCLAAIRSSRAWSPRRSSDGKMWKIAASIAAAVKPASTNYLYYALDAETGTHKFFNSYSEFSAFVARQSYSN